MRRAFPELAGARRRVDKAMHDLAAMRCAHNHSGRFGKVGRRPIACARLEVSGPQGRRRVCSSTVIQSHVKSSWTSTHMSGPQPGQGQHEQTSKSSWARWEDHTVWRRDDCIPAQQLADDAAVPFAQKILHAVPFPSGINIGLQLQSWCAQELLSNYSYSLGRGTELFSKYSYCLGRGTELFSKYSYCRGRGTERPYVTITYDSIR